MERYGLGRPINMKNAFSWFEKSSRQQVSQDRYQCNELREGLIEAQYNLAQMYHYGLGTQKNLTYAAMLYEVAAEKGMKEAQFNVAQILHYGRDELLNYEKATVGIKKQQIKTY